MGPAGSRTRRIDRRVVVATAFAAILVAASLLPWVLVWEKRVLEPGGPSPTSAVRNLPPAQPPTPELETREPARPEPRLVVASPVPTFSLPPQPQAVGGYEDWSASVALRLDELGEMAPSLKLGLDAARNADMAFCFAELERGDDALGAGEKRPSRRWAELLLYLQSREDAVDVVEATVGQPGTLPPTVLECCREVLRGMEIKVFDAVPGQRFRYLFEIEE